MSRDERPLEGETRTALLDQLSHTIEALPAGSLSGGHPSYDPMDNRTYHASPHEDERKFFAEFLGDEYKREGLNPAEKQFLFEQGERRISAVGQHHVEQAQEVQALAGKVLGRYRMKYGDYEDDATLQRAGQRLLAKHGEAIVDLARDDPERAAEMLDDELAEDFGDYDYSEDTGGRTGGMFGSMPAAPGGSGGSRHQHDEDEGDAAEDLLAWQQKHGFTW